MECPAPARATWRWCGATDSYSFDADAGDVAIFDVLAGATTTFRWRLEAPDRTALFDAPYNDRSQKLPDTGTYTLTVRGATPTTTGTYSFRLLLTPPPEEFTIAFGDTVSDGVPGPGAGNLERPGAVDRYHFDATAGQVAILDAISGNNTRVRWRLDAPDGTEVFDVSYTDRQVTLDQTGTYTLTVFGFTPTSFGVYSFALLEVVNQPPVAVDDEAETDHDTPVTFDVLANDTDPDGDTLTVDAVGTPANGTATHTSDQVAYTPNPGFAGTDTFTSPSPTAAAAPHKPPSPSPSTNHPTTHRSSPTSATRPTPSATPSTCRSRPPTPTATHSPTPPPGYPTA